MRLEGRKQRFYCAAGGFREPLPGLLGVDRHGSPIFRFADRLLRLIFGQGTLNF